MFIVSSKPQRSGRPLKTPVTVEDGLLTDTDDPNKVDTSDCSTRAKHDDRV